MAAITLNQIISAIENKLGLDATVEVIDESSKHHGHSGFENGSSGISHIVVKVIWRGFEDLKILDRQRLINECLAEFFKIGLHAVRYELMPNEASC